MNACKPPSSAESRASASPRPAPSIAPWNFGFTSPTNSPNSLHPSQFRNPCPKTPATEIHETRNTQYAIRRVPHPPSRILNPVPSNLPSTYPIIQPALAPWPSPVAGHILLNALVQILRRFVVLPKWAAETLALWILHTFAFQLRDVTTYIGIESPEKRCGKTTLLGLLNELANRAVASSNISPPAFFRVIEDLSPTLLIDEVDTFLAGNDQLKGILNAGYNRRTAFVLRAAPTPASNGETDTETSAAPGAVKRYSCWCPKVLAKIGRFPDTLADRCIVIRRQRKTSEEQCDRSRELDPTPLKQQCLRFVSDHAAEIASARPQIPPALNDRAADIWEPLLALADLAGGEWPDLARQAAVSLSAGAQESNPIASLLLDIFIVFTLQKVDRMTPQPLPAGLPSFGPRPWNESTRGKPSTDLWLAQQLRPYGVKPRNLRIGDQVLRGYLRDDLLDVFRRYIPQSELDSLRAEQPETPPEQTPLPAAANGSP